MAAFARSVLDDEALIEDIGRFCAQLAGPARVAVLGQKLVQLTMPGVPDVYQGCELVDLSLVDPDNRRPVDYAARRALLEKLDGDAAAAPATLSAEKLLVTTTALRLRRERPEAFTGPRSSYTPLATTTGNALAFGRGAAEPEVLTVATRLPVALARRGGWDTNTVTLPAGRWRNLLARHERQGEDQVLDGGAQPLAGLLDVLPVALLVRADRVSWWRGLRRPSGRDLNPGSVR